MGSIPGLTSGLRIRSCYKLQQVDLDLELLWLWPRPTALAQIQPPQPKNFHVPQVLPLKAKKKCIYGIHVLTYAQTHISLELELPSHQFCKHSVLGDNARQFSNVVLLVPLTIITIIIPSLLLTITFSTVTLINPTAILGVIMCQALC